MYTLLISLMDQEIDKDNLFLSPFHKDKMTLIQGSLPAVSDCKEKIAAAVKHQLIYQSYQLMLLVDLTPFKEARYSIVVKKYIEIITAYINKTLLEPLYSQDILYPASVKEFFFCPQNADGNGGFSESNVWEKTVIVDLKKDGDSGDKIGISYNNAGRDIFIDMTDNFKEALNSYHNLPEQADDSAKKTALIGDLQKQLEAQQICWIEREGQTQRKQLSVTAVTCPMIFENKEHSLAVLHYRLGEYIYKSSRTAETDLANIRLVEVSEEEFYTYLKKLYNRLDLSYQNMERPVRFSLNKEDTKDLASPVKGLIKEELKKRCPEILSVLKSARQEGKEESLIKPVSAIKAYKYRTRKAIESYESIREALTIYGDDSYLQKEQEHMIDACVSAYTNWRNNVAKKNIGRIEVGNEEGIADEFSKQELELLIQNQEQRLFSGFNEVKESYDDLLLQADRIEEEYRTEAGRWSPERGSEGFRLFTVFSCFSAAFFIICMAVPYFVIQYKQLIPPVPKYLFPFLAVASWCFLYMIGVAIWQRKQCRKIHGFSLRAEAIMRHCQERHESYIEKALELCETILPELLENSLLLEEYKKVSSENQKRNDEWRIHEAFLLNCLTKTKELLTGLRIDTKQAVEQREEGVSFNYNLAPWDEENLNRYMLYGEEVYR